ncbi:MAG: DUF2165 domain-containing protein [Cytophagales bacterium]|nr:DUF2165 domain-containing protein [Cytophagales bacterium]
MYSTGLLIRLTKVVSVFSLGLMAALVVFGNITDYNTNYQFVKHVFMMDTTFPSANIHYRSICGPLVVNGGYIFIIIMEAIMAFCCLKGSWKLWKHLKSAPEVFHANKNWSIAGLLMGIVIWFLGFQVVGGEWFSMWQSQIWNGLAAADRIVTFITLVLILLHFKEEKVQNDQTKEHQQNETTF